LERWFAQPLCFVSLALIVELFRSSERKGRRKPSPLRKKQQKAEASASRPFAAPTTALARSKRTSQSPTATGAHQLVARSASTRAGGPARARPAARVQDQIRGSRPVRPVGSVPSAEPAASGPHPISHRTGPAAAASRGEALSSGTGGSDQRPVGHRCPRRGEHPRVWTGSCSYRLWTWARVARHGRPRTGPSLSISLQIVGTLLRPSLRGEAEQKIVCIFMCVTGLDDSSTCKFLPRNM